MQWELIQISDLHYGDAFVDEVKEPTAEKFRENLKNRLPKALAALEKAPPDALLVTGDLTVRGNVAALKKAGALLNGVAAEMIRDGKIVAVVPGNHDVQWGLDASNESLAAKFAHFRDVVEHIGAYGPLLPVRNPDSSKVKFELGAKPVAVDENNKIVVICINSAIRCGELNQALFNEGGQLLDELGEADVEDAIKRLKEWIRVMCIRDIAHVTEDQLAMLESELERAKIEVNGNTASDSSWDRYLKVAILHHHLAGFPTEVTEHKVFEATVDAQKVLDMLGRNRVDLVVTGHKHQTYQVRHTYDAGQDEHDILLAGGATVLGDLPKQGTEKRGFNRLLVERESDGCLRLQCDVLPLKDFAHRLQSVRKQKTNAPTIEQRTRLKMVELFGCAKHDHDLFSMNSDRATWSGDHSREWMLWLNVDSCVSSTDLVEGLVENKRIAQGLEYMSMYHLYGKFDVLIRYCQRDGYGPEEGKNLYRRIRKQLQDEKQWSGDDFLRHHSR